MRKVALHWKILFGLALGIAVGLVLNRFGADIRAAAGDSAAARGTIDFVVNLNKLIGDIFKRALQFIAAPIILLAMIQAVTSLGDLRKLGRLGAKTVGIFAFTAVTSVIIGLALVNLVEPGGERFIDSDTRERLLSQLGNTKQAGDIISRAGTMNVSMWDVIRESMPVNPFEALATGNMLQIVVFALMLGVALALLPRARTRGLLDIVDALAEAFISIVRGIMRTAPVGVFCLIVPIAATLGIRTLASLGAYALTVIAGLAIIQFVLYPAVVLLIGRMPLSRFFRGIAQVQLVAFSSSSSAATLPVTIQNVRDKLGVSQETTSFVCALGAKINMDGTAMMQAIATVFLAQFYAMELTLPQQASIVFTAVVSAIGTPGIPSGGMVMLVVVLRSVGVPAEGIAMILAVDRVLDMCRTVVNVTGDAAVAVAVARTEGERPTGSPPPPRE
jgi:proton glutamate symport protein